MPVRTLFKFEYNSMKGKYFLNRTSLFFRLNNSPVLLQSTQLYVDEPSRYVRLECIRLFTSPATFLPVSNKTTFRSCTSQEVEQGIRKL